jgi:hypothetical protein
MAQYKDETTDTRMIEGSTSYSAPEDGGIQLATQVQDGPLLALRL